MQLRLLPQIQKKEEEEEVKEVTRICIVCFVKQLQFPMSKALKTPLEMTGRDRARTEGLMDKQTKIDLKPRLDRLKELGIEPKLEDGKFIGVLHGSGKEVEKDEEVENEEDNDQLKDNLRLLTLDETKDHMRNCIATKADLKRLPHQRRCKNKIAQVDTTTVTSINKTEETGAAEEGIKHNNKGKNLKKLASVTRDEIELTVMKKMKISKV